MTAGCHDDEIEHVVMQLLPQPQQMPNVLVCDCRAQLHFDCDDTLVVALYDQVDFLSSVPRANVSYSSFGVLRVRAQRKRNRRCKELTQQGTVTRRV